MATGATDTSQEKVLQREDTIIDVTDVRDPKWAPECCIYKVPKRLSKVKEQPYTPKLISIGPVHHNNGEFKDMQMVKERYFKAFFSRTCKGQKEFACIIEKNKDKICNCYAPEISQCIENENFVKMVLLDSIFIIELFMRSYREEDENDYILSKSWLKDGIMQDLILLENQLPFFILDKLYQHYTSNPTFLELACNYFFSSKEIRFEKVVKHFTDLQRNFFLPPNQKPGNPIVHRHSATKLDMAGLIFQNRKGEMAGFIFRNREGEEKNRHLLHVEIQKGNKLLEIFPCFNCSWLLHCLPCLKKIPFLESMQTRLLIPHFVVDNKTEDLFRNLMALEQCHYPKEAYICNYILLLDFLINSKDDVELLVEEGIIVNSLGSNKAVADMVNKLGQEIVEEKSYYHDVAEDLNKYYRNWWNKNMESLKTVYFRDILRGTVTVVGVIVLLVTVMNFLRPFVFRHI
ncbi:putative UPF0481 protein At3g02645 [Quercus lobata]|uniref:Uncharacterized protein n=1 Tax=Quercus lobata TaxID=97700 RepID=A0A7N2LE08_QUELO|nr:putative UPF0481 protein At3g02645 [Quercus lobata]XP_030962155.1 putative UPF0481 protein At3g02645 [Quercus lobata]